MKGYSIRIARNYTKHYAGKDWDNWKLHSSSITDKNGRTKQFATIEDAENYAINHMKQHWVQDANEEGYVVYCKIYQGREYIKTVER